MYLEQFVARFDSWNILWLLLLRDLSQGLSFMFLRCSTADGHPRPNSSNKGGDVTAPVPCTMCQHKGLSNSGCLFQLINVGSFSKILSIQSANFVNFPFQWKWSVLRIFTLKPPTGTFTMYFKGIKGFMRSHYHWYLSSYSIMSKPFFFQ